MRLKCGNVCEDVLQKVKINTKEELWSQRGFRRSGQIKRAEDTTPQSEENQHLTMKLKAFFSRVVELFRPRQQLKCSLMTPTSWNSPQGWTVWPTEYGRSNSTSVLRLRRHCGFLFLFTITRSIGNQLLDGRCPCGKDLRPLGDSYIGELGSRSSNPVKPSNGFSHSWL